MASKNIKLNRRKWLNAKEGSAFMITELDAYCEDRIMHRSCEASVKLSDCNRSIDLDFSFDIKKNKYGGPHNNISSRLKKIDLIISELNLLKEKMVEANEYLIATPEKKKK